MPSSRTVKLIVDYLHDPIHGDQYESTMGVAASAIKSFFAANNYPIVFSYNKKLFKKNYGENEDAVPSMNLNDLLKILTLDKPSVLQKAVFMAKFHGGMDASTLADKFNFEAYAKIAKHFGSEDPDA